MIATVALTVALLGGSVPSGMVAIPAGSYTPLYAATQRRRWCASDRSRSTEFQ
jgi:hypothetical protein